MATEASKGNREFVFAWEGRNRHGRTVRGEARASADGQVRAMLRRQGIVPTRISRRRAGRGRKIKPRDIALFTRQMATMMKAGVALLQAFDIVGRGHANPNVARLLAGIRADVETGTALSAAFRKHPAYFGDLYCNLVEAGEAAGILDALMERLATHLEKTEAIKSRLRSALLYPLIVVAVAFIVVSLIMIFVIPAFKDVFTSFGADLPLPTLLVMAASDHFVQWWWLILAALGGGLYGGARLVRRSARVRQSLDRAMLRLPVFGALLEKSCVARWSRTLSTMFAAGVPLVEALDCVGGAAGNHVYEEATDAIRQEVATGTSLAAAMRNAGVFPAMVLQMCAIGEESGAIDHMLGKAADFYEQEVDDMVSGLSSLMEPIIIVFLGTLIGAIVVSMYLPIFKLGQVV